MVCLLIDLLYQVGTGLYIIYNINIYSRSSFKICICILMFLLAVSLEIIKLIQE